MATANIFDKATENIMKGVIDFSTQTFRLMLSNTAPNQATDETSANITEIASGNGYPAGGVSLSGQTLTRIGGTTTFDANDVTITATGGDIGPFRYVVLYSYTADRLVCYWDLGASQSIVDGNSKTFQFDSNGILDLSR